MEFCFSTAVALITQVGERNILLKYSSLKRRQIRDIDLTLSWKKWSIWAHFSDWSHWDRSMESQWMSMLTRKTITNEYCQLRNVW